MNLQDLHKAFTAFAKFGITEVEIATEHDTIYLCVGPDLPKELGVELNEIGFRWFDSDDAWVAFT